MERQSPLQREIDELDATPFGNLDRMKDDLDEIVMDKLREAIVDVNGIERKQCHKGLKPNTIKNRVSRVNAYLDLAEEQGLIKDEHALGMRYEWDYNDRKGRYYVYLRSTDYDE